MDYNFYNGGSVHSNGSDVGNMALLTCASFDKQCQENEYYWKVGLAKIGVKLAHPDDGWVNREKNYLRPCYPYFDNKPQVGDLIALGSAPFHYTNSDVYHDIEFRLVKVIKVSEWWKGSGDMQYDFEPYKIMNGLTFEEVIEKPKPSFIKLIKNIFNTK